MDEVIIQKLNNCMPPSRLNNKFNLDRVRNWKINRGTGTNEIALETEAASIGYSSQGVADKYCTYSRAIDLNCIVSGSYDSTQLVKYSDLSVNDEGIVGAYILSNGSIILGDQLPSNRYSEVRGLCVGKNPNNNKSLFIPCQQNLDWRTYRWCQQFPIPFDVGNGHITSESNTYSTYNGKERTTQILSSAISNSYQHSFFPAANYCNMFNNGITGINAGDWYFPAVGELRLIYPNWSLIFNYWDRIANGSLNNLYWSSVEHEYSYSWRVHISDGITSYIGANHYIYVLPFLAI